MTYGFPNKKYNIILADPPWEYGYYQNKGRKVADPKFKITPYEGMDIEEIKGMPVRDLAAENCALLLWVTFPCLQWGLDVVKAWGFDYKTVAFTWVKKNKHINSYWIGLGNYTRANAEICLLGVKGMMPRKSQKIPQICDRPIGEHSQKPNVIRTRIVKLFGDLPRIELFARTKVHGWETWGNDPKLEISTLEEYNFVAGMD